MTDARPEEFATIPPPLEGRLVRLRPIEEADLSRVNELFWEPEVTEQLLVVWPEPVSGTRQWWERRRAAGEPYLAIETLAGEFVGVCDLGRVEGRARTAIMGIWIGKAFWDKGFGTDAVRVLCRFAFSEMNLQRIELGVLENNARGKQAYEKVGFKEEGRLRRALFVGGSHVDLIVMGLLADELIED
jgi:RimJ/RimL family protein N-acetyltransferase